MFLVAFFIVDVTRPLFPAFFVFMFVCFVCGWLFAAESEENLILFVDELHMILGLGATGEGSMDASLHFSLLFCCVFFYTYLGSFFFFFSNRQYSEAGAGAGRSASLWCHHT